MYICRDRARGSLCKDYRIFEYTSFALPSEITTFNKKANKVVPLSLIAAVAYQSDIEAQTSTDIE
jgi:hypothetical protein